MRGFCQGFFHSRCCCIIAAEVPVCFIDADKRIKGIQIGDHDIKLVNFADSTSIFLRGITCLNRIQLILKLYEKASSSKINFSKSQSLWAGAYKMRTDKSEQMVWSQSSYKMLGVNFGNSALNNSNWKKISESLTKKIYI